MRITRAATVAALLLALAPSLAPAQQGSQQVRRPFVDSWFWGVKGGAMAFETTAMKDCAVGLAGAEWLITRTRAALLVSVDHSFLDTRTSVPHFVEVTQDGVVDTVQQGNVEVDLRGLRRVSAALLAYPKAYGALRPYAGVGFALNMVQRARLTDPSLETEFDQQVIDDRQSRIAAMFVGGAQWAVGPVSVFGQATYMPAKTRFLLDAKPTYFVEAGVRYRISSAFER